jgi:glycosyltransferase involved in cell wall biosynthesis
MKVKVLYIVSNINKALAFEWIAEQLDKSKFGLSFILLNSEESSLEKYLREKGIPVNRISYHGKKDLPKAILSIYKILKREKSRVVHCHLFDACIAGLIAAKLAGVNKRIYTRHHATFHQVYFPRAVWYDKFISALATDVVAISENVRQTLIGEGVSDKKIHLIHHGFKLLNFEAAEEAHIQSLKRKYNPSGSYPVVGVISRYFELKGIQYIIPAFEKILHQYPGALLILANASGNYSSQLKLLLQKIPKNNYREIDFEPDIFALYQVFDIFVHVPIDPSIEAFGQTYVEALAAGIPSIFTLSGVANEFVVHHKNAWVVPFKNSESIVAAMKEILSEPGLIKKVTEAGKQDVFQRFGLEQMITKLEYLYE